MRLGFVQGWARQPRPLRGCADEAWQGGGRSLEGRDRHDAEEAERGGGRMSLLGAPSRGRPGAPFVASSCS